MAKPMKRIVRKSAHIHKMSRPPKGKGQIEGRGRKICQVCAHPDILEMEQKFLHDTMTQRQIANIVGVSQGSVSRHFREHMTYPEIAPITTEVMEKSTGSVMNAYDRLNNNILVIEDIVTGLIKDTTLNEDKRLDLIIKALEAIRKQIDTTARIFELQVEQKKVQGTLNKLIIVVERPNAGVITSETSE